jgi:uncharacterized RDD family membrane protein YckC
MELITVHTTQNIDIDYEVGGLGERIVARLIDSGIFIPFVVILLIIAASIGKTAIIILAITLAVIYTFYDLVCEVFFNGQSLGKKVMKIRVISLDGGRPRLSQFLLRWLFRIVDFTLTGGAAALICAALSDKSQRIGDMVAGTALIRTVPRTQMNKLNYVATKDDYEPVFSQAVQLTDRDIALIHEVIKNYVQTGSNVAVYQLADKVRNHLGITLPPDMNSMQFLQTLLKDYSHITSHADVIS